MASILRKILIYLLIFVFAIYMTMEGYSLVVIFGIIAIGAVLSWLPYAYRLFLDTHIGRLERFLQKQRKSPAIYLNYLLANKLDEEARSVMEQLRRKYRRPEAQAPFLAAYGLYRKDMNAVREALPYIRIPDYQAYYESVLLLSEGNIGRAQEQLQTIKKPWMRLAVLAEVERVTGNLEAATMHAREAVQSTRGIHRYVLYKQYEREMPEAIAGM